MCIRDSVGRTGYGRGGALDDLLQRVHPERRKRIPNRDGGPGHREHAVTFAYTHLWSSVVVFTVASMVGPRVVAVVELLRRRRGGGRQRCALAAVRSHGQRLPLVPGRESGLVVGGGDGQRRLTEEDPQRRVVGVHQGEHGVPGRNRVTGGAAPAGPVGGLFTDLVVGGQRRGVLGRAAAPVGGVTTGLDEGDLDAEARNLLRERLAQTFQRPLRRVVDADGGERGDPADGGDLQDVTAALGAQEWQRRLGDPQRPEQVGLDLLAGFRLAELLDHAELAVAGVVT